MPPEPSNQGMSHLTLGQNTAYPEHYDASLLQAVPRALNRTPVGITDDALPFRGFDEWTGYELSWLNTQGLPQVAIARFVIPVTTPNLIESKSFKLYLNSFNQTRFADWQKVLEVLQLDLSQCAGGPVELTLYSLPEFCQLPLAQLPGESLDNQDVTIESYDYQPALLRTRDTVVEETLHSDLLKSNCLITNQPDWGSLVIAYKGPAIDRTALLQYVVSFRNHNEFHEQCVERIFQDLMNHCHCEELTVAARYTRRGGLDINPVRTTLQEPPLFVRTVRQ